MHETIYQIKLKLTEPLLGAVPLSKSIYTKFVASKVAESQGIEETETIEELTAKGHTGFHVDTDGYFLYDYAVKGFVKEAATAMKVWGALKQLHSKVTRYLFVTPRKIRLPDIEAEPLERPLRASTAMGPRVCLTKSDIIAAGTELDFQVAILEGGGLTEGCLRDLLSYGRYMGLGCWRSGSYGRFLVVELEEI